MLTEFGRLFNMCSVLGEKETSTSEKLLRALERREKLEIEVEKLRTELAEYQFYEYDL